MTKRFKKVTIIGVGLIGGSIGLDLRKKDLAQQIIGVGRRKVSIDAAVKKGAIHKGTLDLKQGVEKAELVVVATPIDKIIEISRQAIKYLAPEAILIDVGSTKRDIVSSIQGIIPEDRHYVGTHPLAGSEKSGVEFAADSMFEGAPCIITPVKGVSEKAVEKIEKLWESLGSKTFLMSPEQHDKIISRTSHIPHLIATMLVKNSEDYLEFAGGSFEDATRVAVSDPKMWTHVFIQNKKYILEHVEDIIVDLEKMSKLIKNEEKEELQNILKSVKTKRKGLHE